MCDICKCSKSEQMKTISKSTHPETPYQRHNESSLGWNRDVAKRNYVTKQVVKLIKLHIDELASQDPDTKQRKKLKLKDTRRLIKRNNVVK